LENPSPDNETEWQWVKEAILNTWQKESNLKFTFWGTSTNDMPGIHIKISDEGPHTLVELFQRLQILILNRSKVIGVDDRNLDLAATVDNLNFLIT
jgi:hypothetical protein